MLREPLTDLATDHRQEVLAIVVLVNFGLAFAVAATIDAEATIRASVFLISFAAIGAVERWAFFRLVFDWVDEDTEQLEPRGGQG